MLVRRNFAHYFVINTPIVLCWPCFRF